MKKHIAKKRKITIIANDGTSEQTISLGQKSIADYDENATLPKKGNKIFGVGYGFNILGKGGTNEYNIKRAIVKWKKMSNKGLLYTGAVNLVMSEESMSTESFFDLNINTEDKIVKEGIFTNHINTYRKNSIKV